jgi:long-chain acyl-CoA synthetase
VLIKDILLQHAGSDTLALSHGRESVSYRELYLRCLQLKAAIEQLADAGNNIGLFLPNSIDYVAAYFSAAFLDKVIVPINVESQNAELISTIQYCEIKLILTNGHYSKILRQFTENQDIKIQLLNIESGLCDVVNVNGEYVGETQALGGSEEDCVAVLLRTSGTTSRPKRVMLTHLNLLTNINSNIQSLRLSSSDVCLIVLPMFFGYCHTAQLLTHLYLGARVVIFDSIFFPKRFFEALETHKVTNTTVVPSMLLLLLSYRYSAQHDTTALRFICFGGGNTPAEKLEAITHYFPAADLVHTYGQTEASPRITALLPPDTRRKLGSVGKPIPDVEVHIINAEGSEVAAGETGEIIVRGKNVMKGYYKRPDESQKALQNGWLHTGDLAYKDPEGFIYLVGRKKNIIISGGINIYPEEIEEILLGNQEVLDAYVFAEAHPYLVEVPVASVVLRASGRPLSGEDLSTYCQERLAAYKVPVRIDVVKELHKTSTGKLRRYKD